MGCLGTVIFAITLCLVHGSRNDSRWIAVPEPSVQMLTGMRRNFTWEFHVPDYLDNQKVYTTLIHHKSSTTSIIVSENVPVDSRQDVQVRPFRKSGTSAAVYYRKGIFTLILGGLKLVDSGQLTLTVNIQPEPLICNTCIAVYGYPAWNCSNNISLEVTEGRDAALSILQRDCLTSSLPVAQLHIDFRPLPNGDETPIENQTNKVSKMASFLPSDNRTFNVMYFEAQASANMHITYDPLLGQVKLVLMNMSEALEGHYDVTIVFSIPNMTLTTNIQILMTERDQDAGQCYEYKVGLATAMIAISILAIIIVFMGKGKKRCKRKKGKLKTESFQKTESTQLVPINSDNNSDTRSPNGKSTSRANVKNRGRGKNTNRPNWCLR